MASQVWPASLPDSVLQSGYEERPPDLSVRTKMDQGPAKVRRRATAGVRPIAGRMLLSGAQTETLDGFYDETLKSGSLRFDWTHPRTQASVEMRFRSRPKYTPVSGSTYEVSLELEIMP